MTIFGYLIFLIASIIIFGSDKLFKEGKIKDIKQLFKVKMVGTGMLFTSVILMVLGKN